MHITVVCPRCRSTYQLEPKLRGQAIRCPKPTCRQVFVVGKDAGRPPGGQESGQVGDVVPILPVEDASVPSKPGRERGAAAPKKPPKSEPAGPAPNWATAPPEVRQPGRTAPARPAAPPPPAPKPKVPEGPSWQDAPPPVRGGTDGQRAPGQATEDENNSTRIPRRRGEAAPPAAPGADTVRLKRTPSPEKSGNDTAFDGRGAPRELSPEEWGSSDVLRSEEVEEVQEVAEVQETAAEEPEAPAPHVSRRRSRTRLYMICILTGLFLAIGIGAYVYFSFLQKSESDLSAQAMKDYTDGKYTAAAAAFKYLRETFPGSEQDGTYRFLGSWSSAKGLLLSPEADAIMATASLDQFIKEYKDDSQMPVYGPEVGASLTTLAENFGKHVGTPTSLEPLKAAVKLEESRTLVIKMLGPDAMAKDMRDRFDTALQGVRSAVDRWDRHQKILVHLRGLKPNAEGIRQARLFIKDKTAEFPALLNDPDVVAVLAQMEEGHLAGVVYEKDPNAGPVDIAADNGPSSIVFELLLEGTPPAPPPDDPVKLALVRGVLYALRQTDGTIKWARRVGIDTTTLPVHVPASPTASDRFLVLSSDNLTLTALDADGKPVWSYRLNRPCLGRPLIVDQRAFLPTFDGVVHEIELARGTVLGRYKLDQRLTVGGVREPETKRLYIPADDSCIYVLDVSTQRCEKILYTDHPAGSLRSEPVIIPPVLLPGAGDAPGFLVLNQADGLEAMHLRVFDLPLSNPHQPPRNLSPEPRLEGWTWFQPHQDEEKIVVLSDRAVLGLFGIRQANNKDQPLFPLLGTNSLSLDPLLGMTADGKGVATTAGGGLLRGRSQVVYGQGDDLWVLARGLLQRIELGWDSRQGRRAVAGWDRALSLGSPLHESQVAEDTRRGRATLFLVTQPLDQQTSVATAVDDEDGRIQWQRQLGLVCQGEPVSLTPPDGRGGGPLLLLLDQGGGLFALDAAQFPSNAKAPWQTGGQHVARALTDNPSVPPVLIAGPDGHVAYELACPSDGRALLIREIEWEPVGRRLKTAERLVPLPSPLAGTPAIVGTSLVFPMAGGSLGRVLLPLAREVKVDEGPDWRYYLAGRDTRGHVLSLGGDLFVTTDGSRGMNCWEWPREGGYQSKTSKEQKAEFNDRIVGVPVVVPVGGGLPRIAVADLAGTVTLFGMRANGTFEMKRVWDLKGKVADGVFVRLLPDGKARLGCIVDGRRLVWLDPQRDDTEWDFSAAKKILGQPQVAGNHLIVVDQSGAITALDLSNGKQVGGGYQLPGSVAPTAGVAAFGPNRAFLPLTDGTALLLQLDLLMAAAKR